MDEISLLRIINSKETEKLDSDQLQNLQDLNILVPKSQKTGPGRNLSPKWHFKLVFSKNYIDKNAEIIGENVDYLRNLVVCLICGEIEESSDDSRNSNRHINANHPDLAFVSKMLPEISTLAPGQTRLESYDGTNLLDLSVDWICNCERPIKIIEDPELIEMFEFVKKRGFRKLPTRNAVKRRIDKRGKEIVVDKRQVIQKHLSMNGYFSVSADGWSNTQNSNANAFFAIILHWIGEEDIEEGKGTSQSTPSLEHKYMLLSEDEVTEKKSGINARLHVRDVLQRYGIPESSILAAVTDSGSDMVCCFNNEILEDNEADVPPFSFQWLPCHSHRLNLVVKEVFLESYKHPTGDSRVTSPYANVIIQLKRHIKYLRWGNNARNLKAIQEGKQVDVPVIHVRLNVGEQDDIEEYKSSVVDEDELDDHGEEEEIDIGTLSDSTFERSGKSNNGKSWVVKDYNTTRWDNLMVAAERFYALRYPIEELYHKYGNTKIRDDFWDSLSDLVEILNPLKILTKNLQARGCSFSDGLILVRRFVVENILPKVKENEENKENGNKALTTSHLHDRMMLRFGLGPHFDFALKGMFLNPNTASFVKPFLNNVIQDEETEKEVFNNAKDQLEESIKDHYALFEPIPSMTEDNNQSDTVMGFLQPQTPTILSIEQLLENDRRVFNDVNIVGPIHSLSWIDNVQNTLTNSTFQTALGFLSAPCSSTEPEREFSGLTNTITKKRNRLNGETVSSLRTIKDDNRRKKKQRI